MPVSEPQWWYGHGHAWQATLLQPAAAVYGALAMRRADSSRSYHSKLPVICVGNFTAGGTGKTPFALELADRVERLGRAPWFLSRGYGGRLDGQERVDLSRHRALDIGDEPALLAGRAPTVVSQNRRLGAEFIERHAPRHAVIIMDDGLQNGDLRKDVTFALVDRGRGFGNGHVIPAGPLRAPLAYQATLADAIVMTGAGEARPFAIDALSKLPVIETRTEPQGDRLDLSQRPVIAFAGIANPQRFFDLAERLGIRIAERRVFSDHHNFSETDAQSLIEAADRAGAALLTTAKDHVRLLGVDGHRATLAGRVHVLTIRIAVDEFSDDVLNAILAKGLAART